MTTVLLSGSRTWKSREIVRVDLTAMLDKFDDLMVIVGDCPTGLDMIATQEARRLGIPVEVHRAEWGLYGRMAGPLRNQRMVNRSPDRALFYFRGASRGTRNCMNLAKAAGITSHTREDHS